MYSVRDCFFGREWCVVETAQWFLNETYQTEHNMNAYVMCFTASVLLVCCATVFGAETVRTIISYCNLPAVVARSTRTYELLISLLL
jgi:hypothetical protein